MAFDILVTNGTVLTVNADFEVIEEGAVGIRDGRIEFVGAAADLADKSASRTIDARGGLILPGLVNTHTHMPMSLFRGLADDLPLDSWLRDHIFPAEQRHISHDTVRAGALLSCAEMLLSGTTCCCDGYFHEDAVAEAVHAAGIRAVLGQGVIDFPAPGVPDPETNVQLALDFVRKWKNRSPLISPSIFCHSPYTCSANTLAAAKDAAREEGVLFQVHVAETRSEGESAGLDDGISPVAWLAGLGVLDENTLAVHAVWADATDIGVLSEHGAMISHNPESNMKLASGVAPVMEMLAAGLSVGLGTDGCASNNNLDMIAEMGTAARLHKATLLDPTVMDAKTVIRMATIEGARALGLSDRIGSIETGKDADLIVVDARQPHLYPLYHPASHMVYAAKGSDVRHAMVAGRLLVEDRKMRHLSVPGIMADVHRIADEIRRTDSKKDVSG